MSIQEVSAIRLGSLRLSSRRESASAIGESAISTVRQGVMNGPRLRTSTPSDQGMRSAFSVRSAVRFRFMLA